VGRHGLKVVLVQSSLRGHSRFTKTSSSGPILKGVKRRAGRVLVYIALFPSCKVEREVVITQDPCKASNHRNYSGTCGFNVGSVFRREFVCCFGVDVYGHRISSHVRLKRNSCRLTGKNSSLVTTR
jgi:hypothetical protein